MSLLTAVMESKTLSTGILTLLSPLRTLRMQVRMNLYLVPVLVTALRGSLAPSPGLDYRAWHSRASAFLLGVAGSGRPPVVSQLLNQKT